MVNNFFCVCILSVTLASSQAFDVDQLFEIKTIRSKIVEQINQLEFVQTKTVPFKIRTKNRIGNCSKSEANLMIEKIKGCQRNSGKINSPNYLLKIPKFLSKILFSVPVIISQNPQKKLSNIKRIILIVIKL